MEIEIYTVEEFQERWDEMIERVEDGESIRSVKENGEKAVMIPADDPFYQLYTDHDEAS